MPEPARNRLRRVVLTGAAGRLARHVRPALSRMADEVVLCDRLAMETEHANERAVALELSDAEAVSQAIAGADAIVHFAGHPREADWEVIIAANIVPATVIWEQARRARVPRIVYASSNHSVGLYPRSQRIDAADPQRPDSRYGVSKAFMETLAQFHCDKHGIAAFGIRIGHCAAVPSDARMLSHWISPRDLVQLVEIGLSAGGHELVFGASANSRSWWDNTRAEALGYRPLDSADAYIGELEHRVSADALAEHFQGGTFAANEHENPSPGLA